MNNYRRHVAQRQQRPLLVQRWPHGHKAGPRPPVTSVGWAQNPHGAQPTRWYSAPHWITRAANTSLPQLVTVVFRIAPPNGALTNRQHRTWCQSLRQHRPRTSDGSCGVTSTSAIADDHSNAIVQRVARNCARNGMIDTTNKPLTDVEMMLTRKSSRSRTTHGLARGATISGSRHNIGTQQGCYEHTLQTCSNRGMNDVCPKTGRRIMMRTRNM